jgi:hypothetical protein
MTEDFLHFIWQFQYFDKHNLQTTDGKPLEILSPGRLNTHAGPDFSAARLQSEALTWAGNVEIHLCSSDWERHQHRQNAAYESVILHVVWKHDKAIFRKDGTLLPVLELEGRTNVKLLDQYKTLTGSRLEIPCQAQFPSVKLLYKIQAFDRALLQRLETKAGLVSELLAANGQDWEETAFQVLCRNFGFKVNSEPFLKLAQRLPLKILQKHADNRPQTEALLFGQAGLLNEDSQDEYGQLLQREYSFLSQKYTLADKQLDAVEWKFHRLRPANFPSLRLAQLAGFLHKNPHIFSTLSDWETPKDLFAKFEIETSDYWKRHYILGKKTIKSTPGFGKSSMENVVINTVAPLLVAWSQQKGKPDWVEKAVNLLESLPAEDNHITRLWESLGQPVKTASDTQAVTEQYNHFCQPRRCLSCRVGIAILQNE